MPHKRSTPSPQSVRVGRRRAPLAWRVLLQRALRARQAGEWQEVGRLLTLGETAPDRPPSDPPSRDVQAWGTLQAEYWAHVAQDWQERARTAEEASGAVTLVATVAREALQTLVRRVVDALDASGAPNPSVREVCQELLREMDAVPWGALVEEAAPSRGARR
jgi:hypothetical protein